MGIVSRISVFIVGHVFNSRYRLASWTRRFPRFGRVVKKIAFEDDDMVVVPKAASVRRMVDVNIDIDSAGDRNVMPSDLVKEVIRGSERIFMMDFCLCRQSNGCRDYPVDKGCIFIGKGTQSIPSKYGHFADAEEACDFIDECDELGLVHIIGRNKLDSIWLHTGNRKDLLTICNCCPCCCLWNIARDIDPGISDVYRRLDGVTVSVDPGKCTGCGFCVELCFVRAISVRDGKAELNDAKCRGCGRCSEQCPSEAISISYDTSVIHSEAERILSLVNQ
ncbi:Indolepyruvate ferredoxin oxidoreductase, alpha and beta subunits [Thermoplasmatales archaeon BRNA1]|nr:Indolepyruvate ferredoxin oxidoreductase, alpha and beta subunits [Thermoplasmatales archaeon BRNA1]